MFRCETPWQEKFCCPLTGPSDCKVRVFQSWVIRVLTLFFMCKIGSNQKTRSPILTELHWWLRWWLHKVTSAVQSDTAGPCLTVHASHTHTHASACQAACCSACWVAQFNSLALRLASLDDRKFETYSKLGMHCTPCGHNIHLLGCLVDCGLA